MPIYPDGLSNPYGKSKSSEHKVITAKVSIEDHAFLKARFVHLVGLYDIILSQLFHALIHELREHERTHGPLPTAYYPTHPSYSVLYSIIQRLTSGRLTGAEGPRDVTGAASGIRETNGDDAGVSPDPQGGNSEKLGAEEGEEFGGSGSSTAEEIRSDDAVNDLVSLLKLLPPKK